MPETVGPGCTVEWRRKDEGGMMKDEERVEKDMDGQGQAQTDRDGHEIPKYFAGWACTEDRVSGGTGQTPDEAVEDYFANYAEDEIDYYTELDEDHGVIGVEVFEVYKPGPDDEEYEDCGPGVRWLVGRRVEVRDFEWRVALDETGFPVVVFSQATAQPDAPPAPQRQRTSASE